MVNFYENFVVTTIRIYFKILMNFLIYSVPMVTLQKFEFFFIILSAHFVAPYFMLSPNDKN
jgi:hypothetical protein